MVRTLTSRKSRKAQTNLGIGVGQTIWSDVHTRTRSRSGVDQGSRRVSECFAYAILVICQEEYIVAAACRPRTPGGETSQAHRAKSGGEGA